MGGGIFLLKAEFGIFVDVDGEHPHFVGAVGADFRHDNLVDSAGEHVSAIIVGVFADEVYTSGRCIKCAVLSEFFFENPFDFFVHTGCDN